MSRIYVINLPSSTSRWAAVTQALAPLGMEIERVDGVWYSAEADVPRDMVTRAEAPWGAKTLWGTTRAWLGVLGCISAHIAALDRMASQNLGSACLVVEDDAALTQGAPSWAGLIERVTATVGDEPWDVIMLDQRKSRSWQQWEVKPGVCRVVYSKAKPPKPYFEGTHVMLVRDSAAAARAAAALRAVRPLSCAEISYYSSSNVLNVELGVFTTTLEPSTIWIP